MQIEILDPVRSKLSPKEDIDKILPCLAYESEYRIKGEYGSIKKNNEAYVINRGSGKFFTGLIPRIQTYCQNKGIKIDINGQLEILKPEKAPYLPGFTFRDDQLQTMKSIMDNQRGVIKNATGTGKTVLAGGICSIWPSAHTIFLCQTLDLLQQSYKAFTEQFGFKNVITLGGGKNQFDWPDKPAIVISTSQTFKNLPILEHCTWPDIMICDEVHHLTEKHSMMAEILKQVLAPVRIGLSAELPKTEKGRLILEGYIGPVIGKFTYSDGIEAGVLAIPLINLIPIPYNAEIGETSRYRNVHDEKGDLLKGMYQKGIVENKSRNRLALIEAINSIKQGQSCLILTARETEHGKILSEMAKDVFDIDIPFIYGVTEKEARQKIQNDLEKKKIKCVISNVIWKEGINIPSLDHVINIGGEKWPIQVVGRGSRTTKDKKILNFTDFLDPYQWLSHHTVLRLIEYAKQGFLDQKKLYTIFSKNNI